MLHSARIYRSRLTAGCKRDSFDRVRKLGITSKSNEAYSSKICCPLRTSRNVYFRCESTLRSEGIPASRHMLNLFSHKYYKIHGDEDDGEDDGEDGRVESSRGGESTVQQNH